MTPSQTDSNVDHDESFRHEVLRGFAEDLQDIASDKEKQDLLISIKSFAFHFIKEPLKRPITHFPTVQQNLDVLWHMFFKASTAIDSDSLFQDRLVLLLLWTRQFDLVYKELYTGQNVAGNWESYGFAQSLQTFWEKLVKEGSEAELRSLATFSSKVLAANICEKQISSTALWYMREALETSDDSIARFLPGAVVWMKLCSHALLRDCVLKTDERQSSVKLGPLAQDQRVDEAGFSIARWLFWRRRFQKLSHHPDTSLAQLSKKGFMAMIHCGRDVDYSVPGEEVFAERLQATMWTELVKSDKESLDGDGC
ncbi:hypothetical protein H9Q72_008486 [Fusarium xylarioides]|uniref:Uncharacterized protein n=1 Tax=Fusarium xylarioides TaxID=221167 RepID=A0A9P7IV62_9HYPO|nr:hypothetical protein H9Q70_000837 [Fusarium xylarioides]KAG5763422.1 hypothetical protein H9Q72_008486 [Fusarium xylarioides]KAG5785740.1 hypothetical protein H9Q73_000595 [Fusarium xylarioides]KAG5820882.1 hypothetical protein H9Q71_000434 [Fusarium xylarioides]KAG5829517.1 hypothetical protein H9Q74_000460 [Fusarium xylarioides]